MGFDLYGMNPIINKPKPNMLIKHKWNEVPQEKQKAYWDAQDEDRLNNPGQYFRSNVWYWRPIWKFVCEVCNDVLTEEDYKGGHTNSGYIISKTKAAIIASRLYSLNQNGEIKAYEEAYDKSLKRMELEECNICDGSGKRKKPPKIGAGKIECNGCNGKGKRKQWNTHYPFSVKFTMEFAKFCDESGGFEIC